MSADIIYMYDAFLHHIDDQCYATPICQRDGKYSLYCVQYMQTMMI